MSAILDWGCSVNYYSVNYYSLYQYIGRTMAPDQPTTDSFLPLSNLSFHILLALGDGPAHGYAIGKEVEERSRGKLKPTTGGLYQALKRLSEDGLVEPAAPRVSRSTDARRQYFRLTGLGKRVAAQEAARLNALIAVARQRKLFGR